MNVAELIFQLKKFDRDLEVLISNDEGGGFDDIIEVKALSVKKRDIKYSSTWRDRVAIESVIIS